MFSIAKVARGRQAYYLATVTTGREHDGGLVEPDGVWLGAGAEQLGLRGTVSAGALAAVLAGVDPASGEILSASHRRVRVAGFDCTFSPPKSVSILHALGPPDAVAAVRDAHDAAVRACVGYLERAGARARRLERSSGARRSVPVGGVAAAAFLHRTSRAPDPHLHSHVLVANCAPGWDGIWGPLDARGLFVEARTTAHLYEAHLRCEISARLGLRFGPVRGRSADLAGIDEHLLRAFSRRSAEIDAVLAERGYDGPRARQIAALSTRPPKDLSVAYETLQASWHERARQLGLAAGRLGRLVEAGRAAGGAGDRSQDRALAPARLDDAWVDRLVGASGLTARSGTFTRGDVIRAGCRAAAAGISVRDAEDLADGVLASSQVVPRGVGSPMLHKVGGGRFPAPLLEMRYTTREILSLEQALIDRVQAGRDASIGVAGHEPLLHAVSRRPLGDRAAADALRLAGAGHAVDVVAAGGGDDGSRVPLCDVVDAAREAWTASGLRVVGTAPGLAAARRLEAASGVETVGVDALGPDPDRIRRAVAALGARSVLVVGSVEGVDARRLTALFDGAEKAGAKLVLVCGGDIGRPERSALAQMERDVRAEAPPTPQITYLPSETGRESWHDLRGVRVALSPSAASARSLAIDEWRNATAAGGRAVVVAPDRETARALGAGVGADARSAGTRPEVVLSGEVPSLLSETRAPVCLVTLGGAAILPPAARRAGAPERVHLIVDSGGEPERIGRALEAALPPALSRELGSPQRTLEGRAAWRRAASLMEGCGLSTGDRSPSRPERELLEMRAEEALRELEGFRRTRSHSLSR